MGVLGFIGLESPWHWMVILVVVLLVFGNRMPSVMRSLGQGIVEFKKGLADVKDEATKALDEKPEETKKEV
jgi:sec-independent protein translocase protein TatA